MTSSLARMCAAPRSRPGEVARAKWIKPRHVGLGSESRYTLVRSDWDLPAPTLTASGQQPDGRCGVLHPAEHRKFTIPELKRLFGLPDDYVFTGTIAQAAERMGNMVPPFAHEGRSRERVRKSIAAFPSEARKIDKLQRARHGRRSSTTLAMLHKRTRGKKPFPRRFFGWHRRARRLSRSRPRVTRRTKRIS